ncbi:MAG: DNA alkylation repair protein, partial [Candidatus Niyogibacteria bacterium]|nr:DNA alkylation repair protein [Candidatus Niyogibacteria bacterium]
AASASPKRAKINAWFFKTAPGEYGAHDFFIGITMPEARRIAKKFQDILLADAVKLLETREHEHRMTALLILIYKYNAGDKMLQKRIFDIYLSNTKHINNWDLVDVTAEHIVGAWLCDRREKMAVLKKLARSKSLWERRIAILSTFHYLKRGSCTETLAVAERLLHDEHDLIHKAVGWLLREVSKRCGEKFEEEFLKRRYKTMPRTMLRYAIERFPEARRKKYLAGTI